MAPGVGTATPMTSSATSTKLPVNGIAKSNAWLAAQMPVAIVSHSGKDHARATSERAGRGDARARVVTRLSREKVRANDLARACREHAARREAHRGGAKRAREARRSQRFQQIPPAQRPDRQIDEHRRQRDRKPLGP